MTITANRATVSAPTIFLKKFGKREPKIIMIMVTPAVILIASETIARSYWDTTMFTIRPKGTTTKLYPMKLTRGLSEELNR